MGNDNESVPWRDFRRVENGLAEVSKELQDEKVKNAEQRVLVQAMDEKLDDMRSDMKEGFEKIGNEFAALRESETNMKVKLGIAMFAIATIASIATTVVARAISLK